MPSSTRPTRDSSARIRAAPQEAMIFDWPLRDRPLPSLLALMLAAGATWLAYWATANVPVTGAIAVLLAMTLWRTWLPVRYELGSGGVVQSVFSWRRRIAWTAICRYEVHRDGVLLLPDAIGTALSPLRGLYLPWSNQREVVIAQLEYHLGALGMSDPGSTRVRTGSDRLRQ